MWFTEVCIRNPVFTVRMMLALLVVGAFSYQRLAVDQFPDVDFPVVVVRTDYPGASPAAVEAEVTRKIEAVVNAIGGVKSITSRSLEALSVVTVEFDLDVDPVLAAQDVREKVALIRSGFRQGVEEPGISRFNPDDLPILSLAILSEAQDPRDLTALAEQVIRRELENTRGVGQVTLVGAIRREIQILLKPQQLQALNVGVDQVTAALRSENQELSAGSIVSADRELLVQVEGRMADPTQFRRIIVARRGGEPVYLSQVADVMDGHEDEHSIALVNGKRAVSLDIMKTQGANTIAVVDTIRKTIAVLAALLPAGIELRVVRDSSTGIRNSIANMQRTIIEGVVLTIVIMFLFLNSWRSTVITALTLPISVIGAFAALYAFGFTLNKVTLMALALCVGLLIDDAVVVRENIMRHRAMGKGPRQAALDGTREIGLAVLAATLCIVAVFLPVAFMGGIIGQFLHEFGVTVAAAVLISMFVSFTLDPMLSSLWHEPPAPGAPRGNWIARVQASCDRSLTRLAGVYRNVLGWGLAHRKSVVALALVSLVGSFCLVPLVGTEFVPEADLGESAISLATPPGSSPAFTATIVKQAERVLREFPEVAGTYATINTSNAPGRNTATIFVQLTARSDRVRSQQALQQLFRERLSHIAGLQVNHVGTYSAAGRGKPLQVSVQGQNASELETLSTRVTEVMRRVPGVVDIDSSLKAAMPMVSISVNRELASDRGLGTGQIGSAVRALLAGEVVGSWTGPDDEHYEITVRLPRAVRGNITGLEQIYLASTRLEADGSPLMVPLRQVADFVATQGEPQINRQDMRREVLVTAGVLGRSSGDVGRDTQAALAGMETPPGYRVVMGGSARDMRESGRFAVAALLLGVVFIYLILASLFASFTQPLTIMMSLPLSLIGVVLALGLTGSTLNLFSIIGLILLMGLVAKNAILLILNVHRATARGMSRHNAIIEAGSLRLRPILLTTLAMIFGMLPMALGDGIGSEHRAPMAHAVIGGLIASTMLTLLVVPIFYTYFNDLASWLKRRLAPRQASSVHL